MARAKSGSGVVQQADGDVHTTPPATTVLDRRGVLRRMGCLGLAVAMPGVATAAAATGTASAMPPQSARQAGAPPSTAVSPATHITTRRRDQVFEVVFLDAQAQDQRAVSLPGQGHGIAIDPSNGRVAVFGGPPAAFAVVLAPEESAPMALVPPAGHAFCGYGVFVDGGARLLTTECRGSAGEGMLGVYEYQPGNGWQRVGQFPTGGTSPHEILALPNTSQVVVAHGGTASLAGEGAGSRDEEGMLPALIYLDTQTGEVIELASFPASRRLLAFRHLARDADGRVWFGCQDQASPPAAPPLGFHVRGQAPVLVSLPDAKWRPYQGDIGAMAVDAAGTCLAVASPRGQRVAFLDTRTRVLKGELSGAGKGGIAATTSPGRFLVSGASGVLLQAGPGLPTQRLREDDASVVWGVQLRRIA